MFYQDLLNFILIWFRTRRWRGLLCMGAATVALPLFMAGLVVAGLRLERGTIAKRYLDLVQADVDNQLEQVNQERVVESSHSQADLTQELMVPLRRILQLGSYNEKIFFVVANELARQGRLSTSVRMMREIAPAENQGFPPAHAWLANYEMQTWKGTPAQAKRLMNDLAVADKHGMNLSPEQVITHVKLLIGSGRSTEALASLRAHASTSPSMNLQYAMLARQLGAQNDLRRAVQDGQAAIEKKRRAGENQLDDLVYAIQLKLLEEKTEEALNLCQTALSVAPDNPDIRRLTSNVLLAKHQAVEAAQSDTDFNLKYLDAALKMDATNPAVMEKVAVAVSRGQNLTGQMKKSLEASLVDGSASAMTHLILANTKLSGDDPASAIPHLRLALRHSPTSPIILNNLAFALLECQPEDMVEAEQLVEQALQAADVTSETRASILDTQGRIRMAQGDMLGAIECFENAIHINGQKLNTREKLAEAYQLAGMPDLAKAEAKRIEELAKQEP